MSVLEKKTITLVLTQDCNLACRYCYLVGKNRKHKMTFEVARAAVDHLLENPLYFPEKEAIWDFMGGEPLLEIELIERIIEHVRRRAYEQAGGYFVDLFYGHEELELSWRLIDHGWRIRYLSEAAVFHPRTDIGRHPDGWRMTGRNRVAIARRTLPWPVAILHVAAWLVLGLWRAGERSNRVAYLEGWWAGWACAVERRPIRWHTVLRLARLGRPPII